MMSSTIKKIFQDIYGISQDNLNIHTLLAYTPYKKGVKQD